MAKTLEKEIHLPKVAGPKIKFAIAVLLLHIYLICHTLQIICNSISSFLKVIFETTNYKLP